MPNLSFHVQGYHSIRWTFVSSALSTSIIPHYCELEASWVLYWQVLFITVTRGFSIIIITLVSSTKSSPSMIVYTHWWKQLFCYSPATVSPDSLWSLDHRRQTGIYTKNLEPLLCILLLFNPPGPLSVSWFIKWYLPQFSITYSWLVRQLINSLT
jgi:hypothetical protein